MKVEAKVSKNVIDRRKHVAAGAVGGAIASLLLVLGINLGTGTSSDPDRDLVFLVSTALDRAQDFFASRVPNYRPAKVVVYEHGTGTACGLQLAQAGPVYCPPDERAYVDLAFLRAVRGDLARAYVIAHELGHHVQKVRGELGGLQRDRELAADCYAGMWIQAEDEAGRLDVGDLASALELAAAVGDDRLCPSCSSEQWSHGSAQQRVDAVQRGLAGGPCGGHW